jgi:hypothetical protein
VIRERDLIDYDRSAGSVTFRYLDAQTGQPAYRGLPIAEFLWRVLSHVLPTGFRRVRDYGFLHGNAKRQLLLVQLVLRVLIQNTTPVLGRRCAARAASHRWWSSPSPAAGDPTAKSPQRIPKIRRPGERGALTGHSSRGRASNTDEHANRCPLRMGQDHARPAKINTRTLPPIPRGS